MNDDTVTYLTVVKRLDAQGIPHHTLRLADGSLLLVSQRGARIYGPFRSESDTSANWIPSAFADPQQFAALIASGHWNVGGERLWIGPEIQYMIPDRSDYWGSYDLPSAMDPGEHTLTGNEDECVLTRRSVLTAYSLSTGQVDIDLTITVRPAQHPLRFTRAFAEGLGDVQFAGYTQRVAIRQGGDSSAVSESWNLAQVRPGGQVIIPATAHPEVTDYYEPAGELLALVPGAVTARITGDQRYKIGVKAAHVHGRAGYFRIDDQGRGALLVRNVGNDPSSIYAEEPDFAVGLLGDSLHVYNDDGGLGGFGEVEARGRTIAGGTGRRESVDEFTSWWFFGTAEELRQIAQHLLGVDPGVAA
ncbi:DUF6786 family protein [Cellulomonas fimi]|uniref:DUF4380 domain-containing protein n=1 Tax=Cellulomonas fimi TaxID=1708 RepID=A0A7Y0LVX8_CELFI|nr:DUF6786 family protein [Cellulomonas fimi]NMR19212.1 hypothetical protein [Cellulomonas fimi]